MLFHAFVGCLLVGISLLLCIAITILMAIYGVIEKDHKDHKPTKIPNILSGTPTHLNKN